MNPNDRCRYCGHRRELHGSSIGCEATSTCGCMTFAVATPQSAPVQRYIDTVVPSGDGWTMTWSVEPSRWRRWVGRLIPFPWKLRVDRTHLKVAVDDPRAFLEDAPPPPPNVNIELYEGERCEECGGDHFPPR